MYNGTSLNVPDLRKLRKLFFNIFFEYVACLAFVFFVFVLCGLPL